MQKKLMLISLFLFSSLQAIANIPLEREITDYLFFLLQKSSQQSYIGESVSQLDHALQAAHLASKYTPQDEELIIAALFHDIAHLLKDVLHLLGDEYGVFHHGPEGALFLEHLGFSKKIALLVKRHAEAKRYLARNNNYYHRLSKASQHTLIQQGGIMTIREAKQFRQDPEFIHLVLIRYCDDGAKKENAQVPGLEHYRSLVESHLQQRFNDAKVARAAQSYFYNLTVR